MPQIIDVPGIGRVEFPDGMTDDQIVSAIKANQTRSQRISDLRASNPAEYDPSSPEFQARYGAERPNLGVQVAGNLARMGAQGLAAIPLAAADAGVAVRNLLQPRPPPTMAGLITGQQPQQDQYELPSTMWNRELGNLIPAPADTLGKISEAVGGGIIGGRFLPNPQIARQPPANYASPPDPKIQALEAGQREGLVVPPTTSNPTATNRVLEGVAGKLTTAQLASARNQAGFNRLANRALGLSDDAPLSLDGIVAVRKEAAKAYEVVRQAGRIIPDDQYRSQLINLTSKYKGAAEDFGKLAKNQEVEDIYTSLNQNQFNADSAVDMISILRDNADEAFRAGKSQAGRAFREASKILENAIERHLERGGKEGAAILRDFRLARELMAKTYSVERAFNASTGNVSGTKLAQQLARGKPLSGELKTAAQFAQAFPKASREFNESLPGFSPIDWYAGTGGAVLANVVAEDPSLAHLAPLLLPFARQGSRNLLLSRFGQSMAVPRAASVPSGNMTRSAANALLLLNHE